MCIVYRGEMERTGCWGWREGDIGCGSLEKEMELVERE